MIELNDRRLLIDAQKLFFKKVKLNYASNPTAMTIGNSQIRIFFNSRDFQNRSSIYSIDFFPKTLDPDYESVVLQHPYGEDSSYFSHGISVGQLFTFDGEKRLSVMGWKSYKDRHWEGRIGFIPLDADGNLNELATRPWMDLDQDDPISLSYPAVLEDRDSKSIWYGSTYTWDAGNGEMVHVIKEAILSQDGKIIKSDKVMPYVVGSAQAFSRPATVKIGTKFLMAYSYRGNTTKYRIGFVKIGDASTASHLSGIPPFLTSNNAWESEMVEYPSFFYFNDQLYMLYNGNSFGKSGIGIVQVIPDKSAFSD